MITGNNICKRFDSLQALDGATFHVERGSVYGLVGPNGSGKSTLIRHIMGIYKADSGELLIDGEPVYENIRVKNIMSYVPDEIYYTSGSTIADMEKLYDSTYTGFDSARLANLIGLFPELDYKLSFRKMSKGMQKQASVLLALCTHARLMVLDEPMDGLDPVARHKVWKIILECVASEGTTVLVSSHNLRELEDVCDHVGIIDHGKIVLERSLDELQEGISKIQVAFADGDEPDVDGALAGFDVLDHTTSGRMHTIIVNGDRSLIEEGLKKISPVFVDFLPLTLEEIFIHELGGADDGIKDIIL